ncbi:MAG TPA: hypothetical protein VIW45_11955 [Vicinamibacterales bacterium]
MISVCPRCGQPKLHHSRAKGAFERFRRHFTDRVPFRCHGCGWRGWLHDIVAEPPPRDAFRTLTDEEYERLDIREAGVPGYDDARKDDNP